jgi:hypothetical protein
VQYSPLTRANRQRDGTPSSVHRHGLLSGWPAHHVIARPLAARFKHYLLILTSTKSTGSMTKSGVIKAHTDAIVFPHFPLVKNIRLGVDDE